jgi:DDE superfamily endonuclease
VARLYHNHPRKQSCCAWTRSQASWLDRFQPVLPMMPGIPERRTHDYARHGVTSLFAAFNIVDGTVISELHPQHRAGTFRKFLIAIDKAVPAVLNVHLVCDNLTTHKTLAIRDWLARYPRFHLHFTRTGSSWINRWRVVRVPPPTDCPPRAQQERSSPGRTTSAPGLLRGAKTEAIRVEEDRRRVPELTR